MYSKRQLLRKVERYIDVNFKDLAMCALHLANESVNDDIRFSLDVLDEGANEDFDFSVNDSIVSQAVEEKIIPTPSYKRIEESWKL